VQFGGYQEKKEDDKQMVGRPDGHQHGHVDQLQRCRVLARLL
jgi:hypothetical protein